VPVQPSHSLPDTHTNTHKTNTLKKMTALALGEGGGGAPSEPTGSNMQPFQEVKWGRKAGTLLIVLTKFYNII